MDDVFKYWALIAIKFALCVIERVTDLLFGVTFTGGTREERHKAERLYEISAHLVRVLWRAKYGPWEARNCRLGNFLYVHKRYVHPNYILQNKNVSLLAVEKSYALFCVTDPSVDLFDITKHPFHIISQFTESQELAILPVKSFHRLAEEIGDPNVPVGMIHMTARCGSTLLTQMSHRVPGTRAIPESWAIHNLYDLLCRGHLTTDEYRRLLRDALRLHCKFSPEEQVERVFMKMTIMNAPQFQDLGELFPQFKFIFNTRHPVPTLKSDIQAFVEGQTKNLYYKLGILWRQIMVMGLFFPRTLKYKPLLAQYSYWWPPKEELEVGGLLYYASALACYLENRDMYHQVILYEDLIENPEREAGNMLRMMGAPEKDIPGAVRGAMETDSQKGTFGKWKKGRKNVLSKYVLRRTDEVMKICRMPIRHDMSLEEFRKVFFGK